MSLKQTYLDAVQAGELLADGAQEAALSELERLSFELQVPPSGGWFRKARPSPKGLYLWGGVGCGKSMLMQLMGPRLQLAARTWLLMMKPGPT